MSKLTIIGASGNGKVVAEIAKLNGYDEIVFFDDNESLSDCYGYPVIGKSNDDPRGDVFVAIGNCKTRHDLMVLHKNYNQPVLIHPNATVSESAKIGLGTVVMAGSVINPDTVIGKGCIINTCSSVDHDCVIDDYVHVAVGAHICGTVIVGQETWVGAGAIIKNNTTVCSDCFIGAGALVIKDINESGTYVGVPVRKIK